MLETAKALGLEDLKGYTTSRVLTLEVTGTDPQRTAGIANKMAEEVSGVACEVMNVDSVNVVDSAKVPTSPSGPKRPLWSLSRTFASPTAIRSTRTLPMISSILPVAMGPTPI